MNQNELKLLASKKLKNAREIYSEMINATVPLRFGEALIRWIQEITGDTSVQGNDLVALYSEIICREFTFKQVPAQFELSDVSLKRQSIRWLTASSVSRENVILLGFGLSMRLGDVERFLTQVLLEQGLNPKDPFETLAWYSFKNNLGYHGFTTLRERFEAGRHGICVPDDLTSTLTGKLRRSRNRIDNEATLMGYLARIAVFTENGHVQSMTARKYFMDMYREIARLVMPPEEIQVDSIQNASLLERVLYPSTPVKNKNLVSFRDSALGEKLQCKRLTRQRISRIVNGTVDITRDDLITLCFALYSIRGEAYLAKHFINGADAMLIDCGMSAMRSGIPYDKLLTLCALTDEPLMCFDEVFARCYFQEDSDG